MKLSGRINRVLAVFLMATMMLTGLVVLNVPETYAATAPTATAKVTCKGGVYIRKSASMSSKKVKFVNKGATIVVRRELFSSRNSTSAKKRWYYVSYGGKSGYVRANWIGKYKYSPAKAKATVNIAYRAGAGTAMKKKGSFKRGATLNIILQGKAKGSNAVWYKVLKGTKAYYISAKNVTFNMNAATDPVNPPPVDPNLKEAVTESSTVGGSKGKPEFTLTDIRYPESLGETLPFSILGKVECTSEISRAEVKILNSSNKSILEYSIPVNSKKLDIKKLDAGVKFGTLTPGKYKYSLDMYIGSKCYNMFKHSFTVRKLYWPDKIASTAIALAWPLGTEEATYKYSGGDASAAFKTALGQVYPNRANWGAAPKVGASCDVFVGTVCRYSGYDPDMPRGLGDMSSGQWAHLNNSDLWKEVPYSYKESDLRNGDIIIYQRPTGSEHVCVYVKINGKGYLAEAAIKTYYGHISKITSGSKIFKKSDKKKIKVYRAAN